jgi:uncharacterized protein (TIGR02594 family)
MYIKGKNMSLSWFETAKSLLGTKEITGNKHNPVILSWAKEIGGWIGKFYNADEIPWCGLFVAYCFDKNNIPVGQNSLGALSWAQWGVPIAKASPGAVLVFVRPGGGHVGFYVSEDKEAYHVLGGNQSNAVTITRIAKNRLKAIRWPAKTPLPTQGPVFVKFTGNLSTNEA